jgi:hypothetical protein
MTPEHDDDPAGDGFVPGPCYYCNGTGHLGHGYLKSEDFAEAVGLTERRLRQLAADGVIDRAVKGYGYPLRALHRYTDYIVEQRRKRRR